MSSIRQYRIAALISYSVIAFMFGLVMGLTSKTPPPEPKQECICSEGLHPVTYETPTGHERKCMPNDGFAEKKAQECRFDKEG